MRVEYEYAVVRLVPRVEREEFVNIGILLYCKRKCYAGMLWQLDEERCNTLFPDIDFDLIRSHLQSMEKICAGAKDGGDLALLDQTERFRWLTANRSTLIQCSATHPGLCESPEETLKMLFEKLIL